MAGMFLGRIHKKLTCIVIALALGAGGLFSQTGSIAQFQFIDGSTDASVYSIAVSGNDVYVAGYADVADSKGRTTSIACYWKNGRLVELTDGRTHALAEAIAVSGNDVYVAGSTLLRTDFRENQVCLWKNGKVIWATDEDRRAFFFAVFGNDVYIVAIPRGWGLYEKETGRTTQGYQWKIKK